MDDLIVQKRLPSDTHPRPFFGFAQAILTTLLLALAVSVCTAAWAGAVTGGPSFTDPTATVENPGNVRIGSLVYVGPFAHLKAGSDAGKTIHIGAESNAQDSALLDASRGSVVLGEQAIVAHGGAVKGPAELGEHGVCPDGAAHCPSFVSFNAEIDGGKVEKDAMVSGLARVGPGVTIPSGRKVLPGKNVTSRSQVATKTAPVTEADRAFMRGVVEVNVEFAKGYTELRAEAPSNVRGINYDPGNSAFNPNRDLPTLAGQKTRDPAYPNRIIGDVQLENTKSQLAAVSGDRISLRADEGEPFKVGTIGELGNRTTFHALEHTHIKLGDNGRYGVRSIVHGGPTPIGDTTATGNNFRIESQAVFFSSVIRNNGKVGSRSLVQGSNLPDNTEVPSRTVVIDNQVFGKVEW